MSWVKIQNHEYFYLSVRSGGRKHSLYFGRGPLGQVAEAMIVRNEAARQARKDAWATARSEMEDVDDLINQVEMGCELLTAGVLLAAGYNRLHRSSWRPWIHGRKTLRRSTNTPRRTRLTSQSAHGR